MDHSKARLTCQRALGPVGLALAFLLLPGVLRAETLICDLTQTCDIGAACSGIQGGLALIVTIDGGSATVEAANGYSFALRTLATNDMALRAFAGIGDGGQTALLMTLAPEGAVEIASMQLTEQRPSPGFLTGICRMGQN